MPDLKTDTNNKILEDYYLVWTNREKREALLQGPEKDSHDARGLKLYASLIEMGRMDLMSSVYPCIKQLLGKKFRDLVLAYYETLPPQHYNLNQSAKNFALYIAEYEQKLVEKYPFIVELAEFEWVELEVMELVSSKKPGAGNTGKNKQPQGESESAEEFAGMIPRLADVTYLRSYKYPVMTLSKALLDGEKLPRRVKKEATWMAIYRDMESHDCRFYELSEIGYALLSAVQNNNGITYGELIRQAVVLSKNNPEDTVNDFLTLVEDLKESALLIY